MIPSVRCLAACVVVLLGVCWAAGEVRADASAAARFEKKGKAAYAKRRWDDAAAAFELAWKADPQARFLYNVARALEKKGDLERAHATMARYVEAEKDDEERADGEAELQILRTRLEADRAALKLTSLPDGARVRLMASDARRTGATPMEAWLPEGVWQLRLTLDGYRAHQAELVAGAGQPLRHHAVLEPLPLESDGAPVAAWVAAGTGAALLAAGGVFGWLATEAEDERDALKGGDAWYGDAQERHEAAQGRALAANVLFAAGSAAALTSVGLLLWGSGP